MTLNGSEKDKPQFYDSLPYKFKCISDQRFRIPEHLFNYSHSHWKVFIGLAWKQKSRAMKWSSHSNEDRKKCVSHWNSNQPTKSSSLNATQPLSHVDSIKRNAIKSAHKHTYDGEMVMWCDAMRWESFRCLKILHFIAIATIVIMAVVSCQHWNNKTP